MSDHLYKSIIDNSPMGYAKHKIILDSSGVPCDYEFVETNPAFEELTGLKSDEIVGKRITEVLPSIKDDEFDWIGTYGDIALNNDSLEFDQYSQQLGKYFRVKAYSPEENYFITFIFELTDESMLQKANKQALEESENKFKTYINSAPYGIFVFDEQSECLEANEQACKITGYSQNELVGKLLFDVVASQDHKMVKKSFSLIKKTGYRENDFHFVTKAGSIREWNVRTITLGSEKFLSFVTDITERKQLERNIIESEQQYKALVNNAGVGIGYFKQDNTIIFLNKVAAESLGGEPADFEGKKFSDIISSEAAALLAKRINTAIQENKNQEYTERLNLPIGKVWMRMIYNSIFDSNGELLGVQVITQNVTDIKQYEQSILESEKKFRLLFEDAPVGYHMLDAKGRIVAVNNSWMDIFGYKKYEVFGKTFCELVDKDKRQTDDAIGCVYSAPDTTHSFVPVIKKNQQSAWICLDTKNVYDENKNFKYTHCIVQDITNQKFTEDKLIESERRLRAIYNQASIGIANISLDGVLTNANPKYCAILGYTREELEKIGILDITYPDDVRLSNKMFSALIQGKVDSINHEQRYVRKDGEIVFVNMTATMLKDSKDNPISTIVTVLDITKSKKLQDENIRMESHLRNQQKLESIGTLAGGVAHEINNPINGIMNYSQLILDGADSDSELGDYATEIIHETERVSTIVKNLLQFSRQEKQSYSKAKVDDIIRQTLSLIKTIMQHDQIDIRVNIQPNLPEIKCRSQQIRQVLMNLMTNARDALNQKYKQHDKDKQLKITCRKRKHDSKDFIRITIEDHGNGIPEHVQKNIFDPFFTTKERNEGTGLGLAISYGIIKEHHGELTFDTEQGKYTRFYLDLPVNNGWEIETLAADLA